MRERDKKRRTVLRPDRTILGRTLFLLAVCGILAFVVLAVKLYEIQIVKHDYYENIAIEQQMKQATITASRGTIYDTNGRVLAISAAVENVFISPAEIKMYEEDENLIASNLSEILDVDKDFILGRMKNTGSWYETIKKKIDDETATQVREFIKEYKLKSIHLEPASERYYPLSTLASQVLGFVGTDNDGLDGVEFKYDQYLTGSNGRIVRLKTERGTDLLFSDYEDYYDAKDGNDLTLTIDSTIQYYVEKSLAQAIEDYDVKKGGMCIAMNPKTFEILAMANYENFDPNNYAQISETAQSVIDEEPDEEKKAQLLSEARYKQWRNKILSDTYEPGSVSKILTLAMALEENIFTETDRFYCGGAMSVLGRGDDLLHCWRRHGHDSQTLVEAMQNSCNIALVDIGLKLGAKNFYKYAEAFGLFDKTGIDLQGESNSLWWSEAVFFDKTNLSQLASASFGQTFNVTPIQMISAVAASINGGNLMKPHIVKEVTDSDGNIVEAFEPELVRQVVSEDTSARVRAILEEVVKTGTGINAYVKGYRIGGKTGTSQKVAQLATSGENAPEEHIVSFCGFAPADDPEIVILMLLDTPSRETGIYISGGVMVAPVVGRMMSDILPYMGIDPVYTEEEIKALNVSVPKLTAMSADAAKKELANSGLEIKVAGTGDEVTGQMPAANAVVAPGTAVIVYMGESVPENTAQVPDLSNLSYKNAKARLEQAGLFVRSIGALSTLSTSVVTTQSILPGEEVAVGTVVEVTLIDSSISGNY